MEMSGRSARRHVEIFNFSFLDILACVIGLLIFILTIVVISGGMRTGAKSKNQSAALTGSQQQLQQTRQRAALAARRRHNAELLLESTSSDVSNITLARDTVEKQIQQFNAEQADLTAANTAAASKIAAARGQLATIKVEPGINQQLSTALAETATLDSETATLIKKNNALDVLPPTPQKVVSFVVPVVHPSSKRPLFIEIQKQHMWFVESNDYLQSKLSRGIDYSRRPEAPGINIGMLASNQIPTPQPILDNDKTETVLTFLVRPDGYDSFRKIREWAWKKGYSVFWVPLPANQPIILVPADHSWEQ